jgi:hypothetical protein
MTLVPGGMSTELGLSTTLGPNRGVSANLSAKPGPSFHGIPNQKLQKMARPYIMSAKAGHSKMKYSCVY